ENAVLIARILFFDEEQAVKNKPKYQQLVEEIEVLVDGGQLERISLAHNRQPKITGHRKRKGEQHLAKILDKEDGEDAIEDKGQFDTHIKTPEVDETGRDGIAHEISYLSQIVFASAIQHEHQHTNEYRNAGHDPRHHRQMVVAA